MYTLKGTIKAIMKEEQVSDKFKKRDFVLTDNTTNYPQHIKFQLKQDKCRMIDDFEVGQEVEVTFFISGREFQNKRTGGLDYFTSLDAWKILRDEKKQENYASEPDMPEEGLPF